MSKNKQSKKNLRKKRREKNAKHVRAQSLTPESIREIGELISAPRTLHQKIERLEYDAFHDLEYQRLSLGDSLKKSLSDECLDEFSFEDWVRCVSYQYADNPLSSRGSVNSIGGRFNVGKDINENQFTAFNALYVAEDVPTAWLEKFGVKKTEAGLENALMQCFSKPDNILTVKVKGKLHNVLDLDAKGSLTKFVQILSKVTFSHNLRLRLKKEGRTYETLSDVTALKKVLYDPDWRFTPQIFDLPARTQTFGQIACRAGIEAIIFKSTKSGQRCMAIFPKNLRDKSYIEISGKVLGSVKIIKLNSENYKETL